MDRRSLILAAGASGALAFPLPVQAKEPLTAQAVRQDAKLVRVTWNDKTRRAGVRMSTSPDAPAAMMRTVQAGVRGGRLDVVAPASPRPYFLVETGWGRQVRVAERLLPLEGGRNFRDFGGYAAAGDKSVKWGKIYRSGVMANLTPTDMTYLSSLGIAIVCDLRSPEERTNEPSKLSGSDAIKTLVHDYAMTSSLSRLMVAKSRAEAVDAFADAYIQFATILSPHYKDMFQNLLENTGPLAVNCTAGKDRTGVAGAFILSVLGVDRDTIVADYALSQTYVPVSYYLNLGKSAAGASNAAAAQMSPFTRLPPEVTAVILGSDPDVMRKTLARMDREFGGPVALAKRNFGLTDAAIAQLRRMYLA